MMMILIIIIIIIIIHMIVVVQIIKWNWTYLNLACELFISAKEYCKIIRDKAYITQHNSKKKKKKKKERNKNPILDVIVRRQ